MILGINKDPSVKTYAYQAYVTSILESKEYVRIKIKDANLKTWEEKLEGLETRWDGNNLTICNATDQLDADNEGFIWTKALESEELIVHVDHFMDLRENAFLYLFTCAGEVEDAHDKDEMIPTLRGYPVVISS